MSDFLWSGDTRFRLGRDVSVKCTVEESFALHANYFHVHPILVSDPDAPSLSPEPEVSLRPRVLVASRVLTTFLPHSRQLPPGVVAIVYSSWAAFLESQDVQPRPGIRVFVWVQPWVYFADPRRSLYPHVHRWLLVDPNRPETTQGLPLTPTVSDAWLPLCL